jgi:hypothetical protein
MKGEKEIFPKSLGRLKWLPNMGVEGRRAKASASEWKKSGRNGKRSELTEKPSDHLANWLKLVRIPPAVCKLCHRWFLNLKDSLGIFDLLFKL